MGGYGIMTCFSLWAFQLLSGRSTDESSMSDAVEVRYSREGLDDSGRSLTQASKSIEMIAKQLWIAKDRPQGCDEASWQRAKQIYTEESNYTPSLRLVLCLLCIVLCLLFRWLALPSPIRIDYEIAGSS